MHYTVGSQTFFNKFQAASYAVQHGLKVHFDMYDSVFDQCDWSREPTQSWDELLDIRANQIAAKNKPIVLYFSGGTDSYTIYKVFERNKIHIDVLYLRRRKTDIDGVINQQVLELLNSGIYDSNTKIVIRDDDATMFEQAYNSEDWIWNKQVRPEFGVGFSGDSETQEHIAQLLGTDDYVGVLGFEKSRLYFDQFRVHTFMPDIIFNRVMGVNNLDCFYISPELPELYIKQSYLMLNWIRQRNPKLGPKDLTLYNELHNPDKFSWDDYATANGRFGDLSISGPVHSAWQNMKLELPGPGEIKHTGPGANWFTSLTGTKVFNNFIGGIQSLVTDPVGKYLLTDPTNLYKFKIFHSKPYRLSFKF